MRRTLLVIDMVEDFVSERGALRVPDTAVVLPRIVEAGARGKEGRQ